MCESSKIPAETFVEIYYFYDTFYVLRFSRQELIFHNEITDPISLDAIWTGDLSDIFYGP